VQEVQIPGKKIEPKRPLLDTLGLPQTLPLEALPSPILMHLSRPRALRWGEGTRPRQRVQYSCQDAGPSGGMPVRREHGVHLARKSLGRLVPAHVTMRGAEGRHGLHELVDLDMQERTAILRRI
jgi:hypothetical protein